MHIDEHEERLFNVRAAVPDHSEVFRNWRQWSDEYKNQCPAARLDVAYGAGVAERFDLFYPADPGPSPVPAALLIHGGYWQAMDKADVAFAARGFNELGIAVCAVNHTLCPAITLAGIIAQVRKACRWIWSNAPALGIDRGHLAIVGHSAGGHLAAMMMCTDWPSFDPAMPHQPFRGCMAISGLFDLARLVNTTINERVGLSSDDATELSPVTRRPQTDGMIVVPVGGDESAGFHEQAIALRDAWAHFGVEVDVMSIPKCNHFQVFERLAALDSPLGVHLKRLVGV
ncbi:MAG: alpha/beta hydrolase [Rhodospirillales bacterium]